ncbi:uncharacterized protein [Zea mays]|uniref:uncharacterized protein n=1 Tax=Zea mays TaxID=4577 RepID=UPI001652C801|nr:uncharacterized protein LOC118473205 [Zea mays]XP_035817867.1 uncharacterized protein LOC118473206 [Zea mays]
MAAVEAVCRALVRLPRKRCSSLARAGSLLGPALSLSLCSCSPCRESLASSPARLHFLRSLLQLYCRAQLAPAQFVRRAGHYSILCLLARILSQLVVVSFTVESSNPSSPAQPHSPARSRLQSKVVVNPCVIKQSQESGEDEVLIAIFPKRSTNCLDRKIATDLTDSCQLWKR